MSMILKNQLNWRFFYEIVATFAQLLKKIILNFLDVDSNVPSVGDEAPPSSHVLSVGDEAPPSSPALSLVSLPSLSGSEISLGDLDDKMLELSRYAVTYLIPYDTITDFLRKRFGETKVGDTVLLAIPDLDRGRCEFPNLTAVVLEVLRFDGSNKKKVKI